MTQESETDAAFLSQVYLEVLQDEGGEAMRFKGLEPDPEDGYTLDEHKIAQIKALMRYAAEVNKSSARLRMVVSCEPEEGDLAVTVRDIQNGVDVTHNFFIDTFQVELFRPAGCPVTDETFQTFGYQPHQYFVQSDLFESGDVFTKQLALLVLANDHYESCVPFYDLHEGPADYYDLMDSLCRNEIVEGHEREGFDRRLWVRVANEAGDPEKPQNYYLLGGSVDHTCTSFASLFSFDLGHKTCQELKRAAIAAEIKNFPNLR